MRRSGATWLQAPGSEKSPFSPVVAPLSGRFRAISPLTGAPLRTTLAAREDSGPAKAGGRDTG